MESGEGIERTDRFDDHGGIEFIVWNPVKELKVKLTVASRPQVLFQVESGEGIERVFSAFFSAPAHAD